VSTNEADFGVQSDRDLRYFSDLDRACFKIFLEVTGSPKNLKWSVLKSIEPHILLEVSEKFLGHFMIFMFPSYFFQKINFDQTSQKKLP
jgi:hypothetical protein